jgi:transcriptional regulator with XRE-family HTH domain
MNNWNRLTPGSNETEKTETKTNETLVIAANRNPTALTPAKLAKVSTPLLAERAIFMEWLSTVRAERQPQTQNELAALLGVSPITLSRWKHGAEFLTEFIRRVRLRYADRLPGIVSAVGDRAEVGDVPAAKLFFDFLGVSRTMELEAKTETEISLVQFEQLAKEASESWEPPSWAVPTAEGSVAGDELENKGDAGT